MAYSDFLIKVGDYVIPTNKFIKANSYSALYSTSDLDSYRDADGVLHRQALSHKLLKIEFETPAMLTNTEMATLMANIASNYTDATEKRCYVTAYVPELDDYVVADCYIPDINFSIYGNYRGVIHYNSVRFAFIEY
jgi:hypothetical protein